MTDASQEGTLAEQVIASWDEKLTRPWDGAVDRWQAQRAIRTVENYYRSKGVPIDALEHGHMVQTYAVWCAECDDLAGLCIAQDEHQEFWHMAQTYGVIVPDSATEGDDE